MVGRGVIPKCIEPNLPSPSPEGEGGRVAIIATWYYGAAKGLLTTMTRHAVSEHVDSTEQDMRDSASVGQPGVETAPMNTRPNANEDGNP